MIAKEALRQVYHFARGTHRPKVMPLGAYPLEPGTFVFRFETSMTAEAIDKGAVMRALRNGTEATGECIELRRSDFMRGGIGLVRTTYSIALDEQFGEIEFALVDGTNKLATYTLDERKAQSLLAEFERITCDAGHDSRYAEIARSLAERGNDPRPSETPIDVAIVCNGADPSRLLDTIESLAAQSHRTWQALAVADGGSFEVVESVVRLLGSSRINATGSGTAHLGDALNQAISQTKDAMLFLRQGDILDQRALARFAAALDIGRNLVYCDVDFIDSPGATPTNPQFKPNFNLDMLYSQNYIDHAFALSRPALDRIGAHPVTHDGAWSYELVLKAAETQCKATRIAHVGCHVRTRAERDTPADQEIQALKEHFARRSLPAHIAETRTPHVYRTTFPLQGAEPSISIIIPNKDHVDYLEPCIESIRAKAGYENYEVIVVENNSTDSATFDYYDRIAREDSRVRIVDFTNSELNDGAFNYPRLINFGVRASKGELLLLLNNDTQVITPGFLPLLAGYFARPEVGVVGALLRHSDGLVQHAGMALLQSGRSGFMNQHLSPEVHRGYLNSLVSAADCSCVLGACQLVSRATFDAVGGYREDLAITGNDIDFCWKVRERGQLVVYTPHVELYHKEFGSRRSDDADAAQEAQSMHEASLVAECWPRYFREGDGFINPNLDPESIYYQLRK